jgi:hypothetical protein
MVNVPSALKPILTQLVRDAFHPLFIFGVVCALIGIVLVALAGILAYRNAHGTKIKLPTLSVDLG